MSRPDTKSGIAYGRTWSMRNEFRRLADLGSLKIAPVLAGHPLDELEQAIYYGNARLVDNKLVPDVGGGSRQFWQETLAWATSDGASINTSVTETIVFPDVTIPGNYMQDGRALAVRAIGEASTLGSGTVKVIFKFMLFGFGWCML